MIVGSNAEDRFEEIKKKFEESNKYMLTVSYDDIKDLIYLVDILGKRNKIYLNSLYGFCASDYISKSRIKKKILELEEQQKENRKLLYYAVDRLNQSEIDKYCNRIEVNYSIREYLQEILKGER